MDLGADEQSIYMTSQKQGSEATNGTAVTANGEFWHANLLLYLHRMYAVLPDIIGQSDCAQSTAIKWWSYVVLVWQLLLAHSQNDGSFVVSVWPICLCMIPQNTPHV